MEVIVGIDEVGRGPLAGPVVACACVAIGEEQIPGVRDSKKLSKKQREDLSAKILALHECSIGVATREEIDKINILEATKLAMIRSEAGLKYTELQHRAKKILVDGNIKFNDDRFESIIKGDDTIYAISCASIVAKVYRDNIMSALAKDYPEYGWESNSGYGTAKHMEAIRRLGLTPHHRLSFTKNIKLDID